MIDELYNLIDDKNETQNLVLRHPEIVKKLKEELDQIESRLRRSGEVKSVEMDEQTKEQLKALGYM
jgi:hypothetical protein